MQPHDYLGKTLEANDIVITSSHLSHATVVSRNDATGTVTIRYPGGHEETKKFPANQVLKVDPSSLDPHNDFHNVLLGLTNDEGRKRD